MAGNELFKWMEEEKVGENEKIVIVSIEPAIGKPGQLQRVRLDSATAEKMEWVQREVINFYLNKLKRILMDISGFYLDASIIGNVIRPEFIFSLASLSHEFDMLIIHSGPQSVQTIAKTLSFANRENRVNNLFIAANKAEALQMARQSKLPQKSGQVTSLY